MKKPVIIVICLVVGILLLAGGVFAVCSFVNKNRFKKEELRSCQVSTGGGMLGGYRNVTLRREKDGSAVLEIREKETHADREVTTVCPADPAAFSQLRELVQKYDLYGASKRRYSDMIALDGDTTTLAFSFESTSFRISEDQVLTPKMREGFREVIRCLGTFAIGEGTVTVEPQTATLYLKSGYTLQFIVENAFDGKLDEILSEEREVAAFDDCGIVLAAGERPDCSGADPVQSAAAGTIVYDPESVQIVVLYADRDFEHPVYVLAALDGYVSSACPLIAEMTGSCRLYLN